MAFGVVGVAEIWEAELLRNQCTVHVEYWVQCLQLDLVYTYLADDSALSWLMELRADERAEPVLLAVGEGGGGSPAWENNSWRVDIISGCFTALLPSC